MTRGQRCIVPVSLNQNSGDKYLGTLDSQEVLSS